MQRKSLHLLFQVRQAHAELGKHGLPKAGVASQEPPKLVITRLHNLTTHDRARKQIVRLGPMRTKANFPKRLSWANNAQE